jgi:L-fucose isomerase-like protein
MINMTVKIGFVPSYRGEWGTIPDWCAKMRAEALEVLGKIPNLEVVTPQPAPDGRTTDPEKGFTPDGAIANLDQGEAIVEFFARQRVDGLIIGNLNFGDERSASKVAEKLKVPVLLYATKEPPAFDTPNMARVSDSYCGTLSTASGLYRRKLPFHYAGLFFHNEPEFQAEVEIFMRACAVVKGLKGARVGQVGLRPANFETVGYDEIAMIQKFGQNVIFEDLSDVVRKAKSYAADDPRLHEITAALRSELSEVTVADDYLAKEARLELALKDFWKSSRLSAMAMSCWPSIQPLYGISMCAMYGRLTEQGMLTACETDILGALSMRVNYDAALGGTVPHFVDWTIQHRENSNWLLSWHCGNAPACLANDRHKAALRSRKDMTGALPYAPGDDMAGLYQFQIKPGKVTFCRLAEYDNRWKMLITSGEIIPSDEVLAGTWAWVEVKDHARLYRTLVEEGFIHHASMIHGDQTRALVEACKFLDIQPVVVD